MDPVTPYLETFEALRGQKRWSANTDVLRFAALTLAARQSRTHHCGGQSNETCANNGVRHRDQRRSR